MNFFKDYSYTMLKLFLNQIALTVFGTVLTIATKDSPALLLASGILAIGLYLALGYSVCWEVGAKDKIRVDGGRLKSQPFKGALIAFFANIPNIVLSLLVGGGLLIGTEWSGNIAAVSNIILRLLNGMYQGIIKLVGDEIFGTVVLGSVYESAPIEMTWWWFIVATLPIILVCAVAYFLGSKNFRISEFFGLSSKNGGKNTPKR